MAEVFEQQQAAAFLEGQSAGRCSEVGAGSRERCGRAGTHLQMQGLLQQGQAAGRHRAKGRLGQCFTQAELQGEGASAARIKAERLQGLGQLFGLVAAAQQDRIR